MTPDLPDSPRVTRDWCPGCEPAVDPCRELVELLYCAKHKPLPLGAADDQVRASLREFHPGSSDESGACNPGLCAAIHRPPSPDG